MKRIKYFQTFESVKDKMEYRYDFDFTDFPITLDEQDEENPSEAKESAEKKFGEFYWKAQGNFYRHELKRYSMKDFLTEFEFEMLSDANKLRYIETLVESKIKLNNYEADWYANCLTDAGYDVPESILRLIQS